MKPMNLLDAYKSDRSAQGVTTILANGTKLQLNNGFDIIDDEFTHVWTLSIQEPGQDERLITDTDILTVWAELERYGVAKTDVIWFPGK